MGFAGTRSGPQGGYPAGLNFGNEEMWGHGAVWLRHRPGELRLSGSDGVEELGRDERDRVVRRTELRRRTSHQSQHYPA